MQERSLEEASGIVKSARIRLGHSQREFAKRVGSKQSLISKYESGLVQPPAPVLIQCMHISGGLMADAISEDALVEVIRAKLSGPKQGQARAVIAQLVECVAAS